MQVRNLLLDRNKLSLAENYITKQKFVTLQLTVLQIYKFKTLQFTKPLYDESLL